MKQSALIIPISNHQLKFILKLSIQLLIVEEVVVYCSAHWILSQVVQIRDLAGSMCCVRYLSLTLCVSLPLGLKKVSANFQGSLIKCWGVTLQWNSTHPIWGGVVILHFMLLGNQGQAPAGWAIRLKCRLYLLPNTS